MPPAPPYGYHPVYAPPSPYASFWARVGAHLIDRLILGMVFLFMVAICCVMLGVGFFQHLGDDLNGPNPIFPAIFLLCIMAVVVVTIGVSWIYYALQESGPHQATLGKRIVGIVVTDMQGRPVSFARASGRFFSMIISGMVPLLLGFIMAAFTEKRQALHDMIASCLILNKAQQ